MSTDRVRAFLVVAALSSATAAGAGDAGDPPLHTRQAGRLVAAVYKDFAPFASHEQGIDAEVAEALAARVGLTAEVREYPDADDVDGDLRNIIWKGHPLWKERVADVMIHVPYDEVLIRKNEQVKIFAPYFRDRIVVARSRARIPQLVTLQVFTSEKIGVQVETLEDRYLVSAFGGALRQNVVHFSSVNDAIAALLRGDVAAVAGRRSFIEAGLAGNAAGFEVAPVAMPGVPVTEWELGLAVKADNPELAAALDRAMTALLADGTIERIFVAHGVKWVPPRSMAVRTAAPPPERSAAEAAAPPAAPPAPPPAAAPPKPLPTLGEEIVVTATRVARPLSDAPAAVTVIPRTAIERSPSKTIDDLLRDVPSFGLFRRSSSLQADPSSQGVNLRGVGPSAVSRSLVLVDGVPANDPFGGWVYWRAVPRLGIDRIEVVPGGGSSLYGNYALGGVTQVFSRPITPLAAEATAEVGSYDAYQAGLWASDRKGPVGASVEAEALKSRGYPVVVPEQRGPMDGNTPSSDAVVNARVEANATPDLTLAARGGYFWEDQNGGTQFTTAAVKRLEYGGSARWTPAALGAIDLSVVGHTADFTQARARITPSTGPRLSEAQAAWQDVPAHDLGAGLVWTSRRLELAGEHTVMVGSDGRRITGVAHEDLMPASLTPTSVVHRDSGGSQWLYGAFAQDLYAVSSAVSLDLAARYDGWANTDGSKVERTYAGTVKPADFAARHDEQLSPKLGLIVRPTDALVLRAAAYRAFRAPTLNELYRPFQVGTVRTDPNPDLAPEKLVGAEAGFDVFPVPGLAARFTGFWNDMKDPITNVTITPTLRMRQNLGQARIRGFEANVGWRFARVWLVSAAYTYADSRVTDAPGQPQLVGMDLPQDPRRRATASLAFDDPRLLTGVVQVRYVGAQYEDDVNTLRMAEFAVVDVSVSRRITPQLDVVLAVENLLDKRYVVGLAGVETIGQPRFIHGGLRVRLNP